MPQLSRDIDYSSSVLKGELLDLPAVPIGQRLGIASNSKCGIAEESRRAVEQRKKSLTIPSERSRLSDRSMLSDLLVSLPHDQRR